MQALDFLYWVLALMLLAWVNSHAYFDKEGNPEGIDYDTVVSVLIGLSMVVYLFGLILRG